MSNEEAQRRFKLALELHQLGLELMRQNLRRAHPDASEDEIAHRLRDWLRERPGAEFGDTVGVPRKLSF